MTASVSKKERCMKKLDFNRGWQFRRFEETEAQTVDLPHDAMIFERRKAGNAAGLGYYPGGKYVYTKAWTVPQELRGKRLTLEFEGVYRHAAVSVNGKQAAYWAYGYTNFYVELNELLTDGENVIEVVADNSLQPNSRWYSGSGIYRPVNLWVGEPEHIAPDGLRITTLSYAPAEILVEVETNTDQRAKIEIYDGETLVAERVGSGTLTIPNAKLWSDENPVLYTAKASLENGDSVTQRFGVRKIEWNAEKGLLINGVPTKLRGACIHHDNGVIGACAFRDAEYRKIRILKEAGFNAIRSAHNPCSKAMLDACDEYGVYVMDEAFDSWYIPKNSKDYVIDFDEWHTRDLEAMIRKDYSHPSVVLYSVGNETIETAQERGIRLVREMVDTIKALDATRPITCGISITQNIDEFNGNNAKKEKYMGGIEKKEEPKPVDKRAKATPAKIAFANLMTGLFAKLGSRNMNAQVGEDAIHGVCKVLDIPGYNYGEVKHDYDSAHGIERVVVSSETHHTELFENWARIEKTPRIIGDFMWVGWDYIGETGVGALGYLSRGELGFEKPYPCLTSGSGIIDITGFQRPEAAWSRMAWGLQTEPVIAVEPLNFAGEPYMKTYWNDTEAVDSWSWPGFEGKKATVKVYTPDARVELFLNGKLLGKKSVKRNMAAFTVTYTEGILRAVTYDATGTRRQETELRSADRTEKLRVVPEVSALNADGQNLCYLNISVTDKNGNVKVWPEREIEVAVSGAGTLQGFGSGAVFSEEALIANRHKTFNGRALAVIRAGYEAGEITVTVRCGALCKTVTIPVN